MDNLNKAIAGNAAPRSQVASNRSSRTCLCARRHPVRVRNNGGGHGTTFFLKHPRPERGRRSHRQTSLTTSERRSAAPMISRRSLKPQASVASAADRPLVSNGGKPRDRFTANRDNPLMAKAVAGCEGKPLLGVMWEHAYYLKYQNKRGLSQGILERGELGRSREARLSDASRRIVSNQRAAGKRQRVFFAWLVFAIQLLVSSRFKFHSLASGHDHQRQRSRRTPDAHRADADASFRPQAVDVIPASRCIPKSSGSPGRSAAPLRCSPGNGYVAVPEIWHEFESAGCIPRMIKRARIAATHLLRKNCKKRPSMATRAQRWISEVASGLHRQARHARDLHRRAT